MCHPFLCPVHFLPWFLGCGKGPFYDISHMGEFSKGCIPREGQKTLIMHIQCPLASRLGTVKGYLPTLGPNNVLAFTHLTHSRISSVLILPRG